MTQRMTSLSAAWQSAKIIRTREKISFFIGVMSLLYTALIFGLAPQSVHQPFLVPLPFSLTSLLQMDSHCIHRTGGIPASHACLSIQEEGMALLPIRFMLFLHAPQLRLHLAAAIKCRALRCLLLFITWVPGQCRHHMAEQPRIS